MALETVQALVYGMALGDAVGAVATASSPAEPKALPNVGLHLLPEQIRLVQPAIPWGETPIIKGYLYHRRIDNLHKVAQRAQYVDGRTIGAPAGVAAAYIAALALNGAHDHEYARRVVEFTDGISDTLDAAFYRLGHALAWTDEVGAMDHIARDDSDESLVTLACYCLMRHPTEFASAVLRATSYSGGGARLGCIVGGFMGAKLGLQAIPPLWRLLCEKRQELNDVAKSIYSMKGQLS